MCTYVCVCVCVCNAHFLMPDHFDAVKLHAFLKLSYEDVAKNYNIKTLCSTYTIIRIFDRVVGKGCVIMRITLCGN